MKVCAIIPAAGQGNRMGGPVPKQFLLLKGRPILSFAIDAFEKSGIVDSVVLVTPAKELAEARETWLRRPGIVRQVVVGGEKRQDSVYNGLQALDADTEIVVVHDGVRPFVTPEMIRETAESAARHGACIVAIPVNDTIKQATADGFVERTVDRNGLWRVQTPQAFRYEVLKEAFDKAAADSFYGTDEGSLIEYLGREVKIVCGSEMNLKITRPEDLVLGECIAAAAFPSG